LNTNDLLDLFDNLPVEFVPRSRLRNRPQERSTFTHSCHELSVLLDGQRIKYEHQPTFLGVRMLSFKSHLTKTAAKLKNRNNLPTKLAGSSWGADADTLQTSALALCYSVGEYCAPVWCRSAHTGLVDTQLNSTMHLISCTLRPTPLLWLPVLANIEPPPAVRGKAATDRLAAKASAHESWPLHHDISPTHHNYACHPESLYGVSWNQLTSRVSGENPGSRPWWSMSTSWTTPQSDSRVLLSLDNSGLS